MYRERCKGRGGVGTKNYQGTWGNFWRDLYVLYLDYGEEVFTDIHINQNTSKYTLRMWILFHVIYTSIKPAKNGREIKAFR